MQNTEKIPSISHLNDRINQSQNADFKSTVRSADGSDLINKIINFLTSSGLDINSYNEFRQTPLHLALVNSNFQAAQLLLSLDADILVADDEGFSTLQLCFKKESKVPEYVIGCFLERLKKTNLNAQQMADELHKSGCPILQALVMNNAEITARMLDRRTSIDKRESQVLLNRAMSLDYPDNVKALVKHGPGLNERLRIFFDQATAYESEPAMKFYFDRLVKWDVINEEFLGIVASTFSHGSEEDMQKYFDLDIEDYAREKFGYEMLAALFGNEKVDCLEIIRNKRFDVNALYAAVMIKNRARVVYLLEHGADPNVKGFLRRTPLMMCRDDRLTDLLLEAGADVQVIDEIGKTIMDAPYPSDSVIAHLCILEARGLLKKELADAVKKRSREYRNALASHREDLEWMKNRRISGSVSLFSLLVDEIESMARHVKSEDDITAILEASVRRIRKLKPIFMSMLMKNLLNALELAELRDRAAAFLSRAMIMDRYGLVVEKIVGFLTYRDLLILDKTEFEE